MPGPNVGTPVIATLSADQAGTAAFGEIEVDAVDPDLARHLGGLKDATSMGINLLHHSLDVAHLAGLIAAELGLDVRLAQRAGLLHDIGKTVVDERTHIDRGTEIGEQHGEHPVVQEVIARHHDPNDGLSPYTFAVKAADVLASSPSPVSLEESSPQVMDLKALADSQDNVRSIYAVRVPDEIWVLIQATGPTDVDAVGGRVREMLSTDATVRITLAAGSAS